MYRGGPLLGLLVVVLIACDPFTSGPQGGVSPAVFEQGAVWTYDVSVTQSPLDTSAVDTLAEAEARMEVADMEAQLGDRSGLAVLDIFLVSAPDSVERTWYHQSPDSLVDVAYRHPASVDWVQPLDEKNVDNGIQPQRLVRGLNGLPMLVGQHLASSAPSSARRLGDSIQVRDDPRIVLQAPLRKGQSWTSFREPILSRRTVVGRSAVETTAGTFDAVEVRNTLPEISSSLRWTDYYAEEGLVRRIVVDTTELRGPDGTRRGRAALRESYDLLSYED